MLDINWTLHFWKKKQLPIHKSKCSHFGFSSIILFVQTLFPGLIVFLLITILISCLLSSYSFSALTVNFNDNCVTGASLSFKRIPFSNETLTDQAKHDAEFYRRKSNELDKDFRSYYLSKEVREASERAKTATGPKTQIYQLSNDKSNAMWSTTKAPNQTYMTVDIPSNDTDFFKNCKFI